MMGVRHQDGRGVKARGSLNPTTTHTAAWSELTPRPEGAEK